jgi:hypothetical protein
MSGERAMESTETDGIETAPDREGFHVPRLLRRAEVRGVDGRVLRGRVFLPASAESHAGAMRIEEWMNDEAPFFPFLPDGEGTPVILNKDQLVTLSVAASSDRDATLAQVRVPVQRVGVECDGIRLEGEVVIDMPANNSRVLDLLNREGSFLTVRAGQVHHLVRKARITRVRELSKSRLA